MRIKFGVKIAKRVCLIIHNPFGKFQCVHNIAKVVQAERKSKLSLLKFALPRRTLPKAPANGRKERAQLQIKLA